METCQALTRRGYTCSNRAKYCLNYSGEKVNFCWVHKTSRKNKLEPEGKEYDTDTSEYYYNKRKGKLVVKSIGRVKHDPDTNLPLRYTAGLSKSQKMEYARKLRASKREYLRTGKVSGRTPVRGFKGKPVRSRYSELFEEKYGFKVTDLDKVKKTFPDTNVNKILAKGRSAYMSGSRPTVTGSIGSQQWAYARLASVLTHGKALAVDKDLVGPKSLKKIYS